MFSCFFSKNVLSGHGGDDLLIAKKSIGQKHAMKTPEEFSADRFFKRLRVERCVGQLALFVVKFEAPGGIWAWNVIKLGEAVFDLRHVYPKDMRRWLGMEPKIVLEMLVWEACC